VNAAQAVERGLLDRQVDGDENVLREEPQNFDAFSFEPLSEEAIRWSEGKQRT
jgi:hypothetical protein